LIIKTIVFFKLFILFISINLFSQNNTQTIFNYFGEIIVGAEQTHQYLPLLKGKRVGVVANQTSVIGETHLVDSLLFLKVNILKIFCPEHGFRGDSEAGAHIDSEIDFATGLPIISLHGDTKKPSQASLKDIDIVIFDIQDVGARFYTYISTLHYVMEACAENKVKLLIFDRPNPNGYFVDGPVLSPRYKSFVGMHPVPIAHGMTIGEYAQMLNGEKWLCDELICDLSIIKCQNYNHQFRYEIKIPPSPNLQTMASIYLYPSLCLFEGTNISIGRGTEKPFEIFGHPNITFGEYSFTPIIIPGKSENPLHKDNTCYGYDLTNYSLEVLKYNNAINLKWLIETYNYFNTKNKFFTSFFNYLVGNPNLKYYLIFGLSEIEIRDRWKKELNEFKNIRKKYLLYTDFE